MTDHVIQHSNTEVGLSVRSTRDGEGIAVELNDERTDLDHKLAEEWYQTFALLALAPPELIEAIVKDVPPEYEDVRPFLVTCLKAPGTAASFAVLFKYALFDAQALREKTVTQKQVAKIVDELPPEAPK